MRELSLWDADGLEQAFGDIDELVASCRFGNCRHNGEPGCALAAALAAGSLDEGRLLSWQKLQRETAHHERRVDALARTEERRKWKAIGKTVSKHMDAKYGAEGWR
jgi:ribosome biogenesis GTPase